MIENLERKDILDLLAFHVHFYDMIENLERK
jgi:hypothetical protein